MNQTNDPRNWPKEAGPARELVEIEPPPGLEAKVVDALKDRGMLDDPPTDAWRPLRIGIALAASLALVALGFLIGRHSGDPIPGSLTGAETSLYALLLYETPDFDRAQGAAARARFSEYSQWVALARKRGQFVTGEDLEVERGWRVFPGVEAPMIEPGVNARESAPLSGVFFIHAEDHHHALALASELPHVRHGGTVVVQKTIPTDVPPPG